MSDSNDKLVLGPWERRAVIALLLVLAGLRFVFPGLPIDTTLIGLLGLSFVVWKLDIESLQFLGVTGKRRARELDQVSSDIDALPPATKVETPEEPEALRVESNEVDWQARASAAALDLDVPTEPRSRILWAAEQIRIELTILAGNSGNLPTPPVPWASLNPRRLAEILVAQNQLPEAIANGIRPFVDIRNRVAHGRSVASELLESADAAGVSLVTALREIPREWVRVVRSGVPIYSDRAGSLRHSTGIEIVKLDNDGTVLHRAVYPSSTFVRPGAFVTWAWDRSQVSTEEGWYHDPKSGEPKLAWSRSAAFAGIPYPDQWGLMYRFPRPDVGVEEVWSVGS
jgi:hypothetical protein